MIPGTFENREILSVMERFFHWGIRDGWEGQREMNVSPKLIWERDSYRKGYSLGQDLFNTKLETKE